MRCRTRPSAASAPARPDPVISCPTFSCSLRISASRSSRPVLAPRSNTCTSPSLALRFRWLTWFGCTRCFVAICRTVLSPHSPSFAARALKAAVNVRRFAMLAPFNPGEVHLTHCPKSRTTSSAARCQDRPTCRSSQPMALPMHRQGARRAADLGWESWKAGRRSAPGRYASPSWPRVRFRYDGPDRRRNGDPNPARSWDSSGAQPPLTAGWWRCRSSRS